MPDELKYHSKCQNLDCMKNEQWLEARNMNIKRPFYLCDTLYKGLI